MTSRFRLLSLVLLLALALCGLAAAITLRLWPHAPNEESASTIAQAAAAEAITITPHRALYDLKLADAHTDSGINNAGGQLLFAWGDSCDGWTIEQRLNLAFSYTEGGTQHIQTSLASWEAKDGSNFRFTVRRQVNGKAKEAYEGTASLAADGSGKATYTVPSGHTVDLTPNSLFPTIHTLQILRAAKAGRHLLTRDVFDGADEQGQNQVTAFISKPVEILATGSKANALDHGRGWPVHLAFFAPAKSKDNIKDNPTSDDPATEGGMPDYEMSMTLLENGVAHDLVIDYGDFTVNATLRAVEPLPQPHC